MLWSTVKLFACQVTKSSLESEISLQAKLVELRHPSFVSQGTTVTVDILRTRHR